MTYFRMKSQSEFYSLFLPYFSRVSWAASFPARFSRVLSLELDNMADLGNEDNASNESSGSSRHSVARWRKNYYMKRACSQSSVSSISSDDGSYDEGSGNPFPFPDIFDGKKNTAQRKWWDEKNSVKMAASIFSYRWWRSYLPSWEFEILVS